MGSAGRRQSDGVGLRSLTAEPILLWFNAAFCGAAWMLTLLGVGPAFPATVAGVKLIVAPGGSPVAEKVTVPG